MYAVINTNSANHILIHVPHEGAEKSLPQLVAMLENNAVFVKSDYYTMETVTPSIQINLGQQFTQEGREGDILVAPSGCVIDDDFVIEKSEAHISMKRKIEEVEKQNRTLRAQLDVSRNEIESMKMLIADLQNSVDDIDASRE